MPDYTPPTTEDVLTAALDGGIYSESDWDRWLMSVKAEAWDEGYEASAAEEQQWSTHGRTDNPYRED